MALANYMRECTECVPKSVLEATLGAAREQPKGRSQWATATAAHMATPKPTLKDLNLTPFSPNEIKEAQQPDSDMGHMFS